MMVSTTARIDRRHEPKMQKANFELLWLSFEHETTKTKAKPKQFSPNPNFLQKMRIFPNHHSQLSKSNSSTILHLTVIQEHRQHCRLHSHLHSF